LVDPLQYHFAEIDLRHTIGEEEWRRIDMRDREQKQQEEDERKKEEEAEKAKKKDEANPTLKMLQDLQTRSTATRRWSSSPLTAGKEWTFGKKPGGRNRIRSQSTIFEIGVSRPIDSEVDRAAGRSGTAPPGITRKEDQRKPIGARRFFTNRSNRSGRKTNRGSR